MYYMIQNQLLIIFTIYFCISVPTGNKFFKYIQLKTGQKECSNFCNSSYIYVCPTNSWFHFKSEAGFGENTTMNSFLFAAELDHHRPL